MFKRITFLAEAIKVQKNWLNQVSEIFFASKQTGPVHMQLRNGYTLEGRRGTSDRATMNSVWLERMYALPHVDWSNATTCIDIGGHIGSATVYFASQNPDLTVYTFEPSPQNFAQLQHNIQLNDLAHRVHIHQMAVDKEEGTKTLHLMSTTGGNSFYSYEPSQSDVEVQTTTLQKIFDDNNVEYCDVLKIDCEGAEYPILYAASPELLARIGTIVLEHHAFSTEPGYDVDSLEQYLTEHGFSCGRPDKYILVAKRS